MLDEQELEAAIERHYSRPGDRLFRMEVQPRYLAGQGEEQDFQRYLAGDDGPDLERKEAWLRILRDEADRGLVSTRVRVLSEWPTEYERYEVDWCYRHNVAAGDDVRVLHDGEHALPADLIREDFWLVNDQLVIPMHYDQHGRFLGAELVREERLVDTYRQARDAAWGAAVPVMPWWERHTELHRGRRAA